MGKKSKSKKQRRDYHYQPNTPAARPVSQPTSSMLTPVEGASPAKTVVTEDDHIRRDIVRILIILGIIAVLLIGMVIVSHKSTIIQNAGHRFSSFLQL